VPHLLTNTALEPAAGASVDVAVDPAGGIGVGVTTIAITAITMDTYPHVLPGMQEGAAQAVEDLLEEAQYRRRKIWPGKMVTKWSRTLWN
jgi:hypothetical protein